MRRFGVLAALALLGAAPAPDIGPEPSWQQGVALGEQSLKAGLIDPGSAQIEWPYAFIGGTLKALLGKTRGGWYTCGFVNARNRMGGYTGRAWFLIMINRGVVTSLDIGTVDEIDTASVTCPDLLKRSMLKPAPSGATAPAVSQADIERAATLSAQTAAAKGGIGISFEPTPFGGMIMAVAPGSPGEKAGLKPGETIESANGIPLKGMSPAVLIAAVSAPAVKTLGIVGVGEVQVRP